METVTTTAPTSTVTTVTASTFSGVPAAASTAFPLVPIYKPKFDWTASNLYERFKLFKQKCTYLLINGPYSHVPGHLQVSVFLNWFGDRSYELINTIEFSPRKSKDVLTVALNNSNHISNLASPPSNHGMNLDLSTALSSRTRMTS